jgi:hypothetical protein
MKAYDEQVIVRAAYIHCAQVQLLVEREDGSMCEEKAESLYTKTSD